MQRINYDTPDLKRTLRAFAAADSGSSRVAEGVAAILADIRARGDAAVAEHVARIDKVDMAPGDFRVPEAELQAAAEALDDGTRAAILEAIENVCLFHRKGLPTSWLGENPHGATVGERFYSLDRVGLYIPGGNAPLVSTIVMTAVPAMIAGVPSIAAFTPPGRDGKVNGGLLAAFHLCGVKEVYRVGGPMAVAAMAFGTETIEPVCKIFGPGNAYVAEAKKQVNGIVGIDIFAGPSEVLIVADASANPAWVAADLIAQAEHGSGFEKVTLVTLDAALPDKVAAELQRQIPARAHRATIEKVLANGYMVVDCDSFEQACEVANFMAPEHLEAHLPDALAASLPELVHSAGALFLGHYTPTVLGDFAAGPNHTLPTVRTGRFSSGLQIADFLRRSSVTHYDASSIGNAAKVVRTFARLEQLDGHGECLEIRLGQ
ncbi:MAG: histidinol dehydrogenase [Opitutales bacterium]|jgi:histidinol dehydrogenase